MKASFTSRLFRCGKTLQRRRWIAVACVTLMLAGALLHAVEFWGARHGLQERNALGITVVLIAGVVAAAGTSALLLLRRPPRLRVLAAEVEARHPELLDSLITAVERSEQGLAHHGPLDEGLARTAEARTQGIDFSDALIPSHLRRRALIVAAAIAAPVFLSALATDTVRKSLFAWSDWRDGIKSGIRIAPENPGVARGSNVTIEAEILRWEPAAEIQFHSDGRRQHFPMVGGADDIARFTFYTVDEPIRFRVATPSLRTEWHTVTPYEPPRLKELQIEARPPAYTGLEPSEYSGVSDIRIVEGTALHFSAIAENTTALDYRGGERILAFNPADDSALVETSREWSLDASAARSERYRIRAQNPDTYVETRESRLEVYPDERPGVEILEPARDVRLEHEESLDLVVYATDDFGLAEITVHLSIAGRIRDRIDTPPRGIPGEPIRETTVATRIDLASLDVKEGDILTYYVAVTDNREPEPQATRSEVFFVEIRAEEDPDEIDGAPEDEERLDLRAYIEELKRLIRLTHRATADDGESRLERNQQIGSGLVRLRGEVNREYESLRDVLARAGDLFFTRGFEATLSLLDTAERLITRGFNDSSILSQEQALQELISMENELRQNVVSRDSEAGDEGESGEGDDSGDSADADTLQDQLARLRDVLEEVRALHDNQNAQNLRAERAGRTGAGAEELGGLAEAQSPLRESSRQLERRLESISETEAARIALRRAQQQMGRAGARLESMDADGAWREGVRAADALEAAARHLQDRLDSAVSTAMQAIEERARELADRQRGAADASADAADSGDGNPGLHNEQLRLNERFGGFLDAVNRFAGEISRSLPDAARALRQSTREAREGTPGTEMSRAANALLYDRWEQARALQETAGAGLEELADKLARAGDELPGLTGDQLDRLLAELSRDRQDLNEMASPTDADDGARLDGIRQDWSSRLEQMGERLGDPALEGIAEALGHSDGDPADLLRDSAYLLREAHDHLLRYRESRERRRILDLRRQSAPPPEQYRRQVEEYFRKLSEESE